LTYLAVFPGDDLKSPSHMSGGRKDVPTGLLGRHRDNSTGKPGKATAGLTQWRRSPRLRPFLLLTVEQRLCG
jgi:hypothetical protein